MLKSLKQTTNKITCEDCNLELTQKNYARQIQSLKQKKNERVYNRNKIIERATEAGVKVTN